MDHPRVAQPVEHVDYEHAVRAREDRKADHVHALVEPSMPQADEVGLDDEADVLRILLLETGPLDDGRVVDENRHGTMSDGGVSVRDADAGFGILHTLEGITGPVAIDGARDRTCYYLVTYAD